MSLVHEQLLLLTKCYDDEPYAMQHDKSKWSETNYTRENNIWLVGQIWILLGFSCQLTEVAVSVMAKQQGR